MTGTNRNHDRSGLGHALLDPAAPIGVAPFDQRLLELGGGGEVMVERACDGIDVAARPGAEHLAELLVHALRLIDRALEQCTLRFLRKRIEETELLDVALELADR